MNNNMNDFDDGWSKICMQKNNNNNIGNDSGNDSNNMFEWRFPIIDMNFWIEKVYLLIVYFEDSLQKSLKIRMKLLITQLKNMVIIIIFVFVCFSFSFCFVFCLCLCCL